jgi:hypothetical protein
MFIIRGDLPALDHDGPCDRTTPDMLQLVVCVSADMLV